MRKTRISLVAVGETGKLVIELIDRWRQNDMLDIIDGDAMHCNNRSNLCKKIHQSSCVLLTGALGHKPADEKLIEYAALSRSNGHVTIGVFSIPFRYEGPRVSMQSDLAYSRLASECDVVIKLPAEAVLADAGRHISIEDAVRAQACTLEKSLWTLTDLLLAPAAIKTRRSDMFTFLQEGGQYSLALSPNITGRNHITDAIHLAITSPMLDSPIYPARQILLHLTTGTEINRIDMQKAVSKSIATLKSDHTRLMIGWKTVPDFTGQARASILVSGIIASPQKRVPVQYIGNEKPVTLTLHLSGEDQSFIRSNKMAKTTRQVKLQTPGWNPILPYADSVSLFTLLADLPQLKRSPSVQSR
jgi:cell division GTPase FtsZ